MAPNMPRNTTARYMNNTAMPTLAKPDLALPSFLEERRVRVSDAHSAAILVLTSALNIFFLQLKEHVFKRCVSLHLLHRTGYYELAVFDYGYLVAKLFRHLKHMR